MAHTRPISLFFAFALLLGTFGSATTQPEDPVNVDPVTILLMGVDAREGEPIDEGVRPDALGVLRIDPRASTCRLLSIPRDALATIPGIGTSKINHAHDFGGVDLQIDTVSGFLGIGLDHYGLLDMAGFKLLVDAVGGITVQDPDRFSMEYYEGSYAYVSSPQTLDGEAALAYARYRYGPDGDFGRIRRHQQLVQSFLESTRELDLESVIREVLSILQDHARTDMSVEELLRIGQAARELCTADTIEMDWLAGMATTAWDDAYQQELWIVAVEPDELAQKVAWLLGT